MAFEYDSQTQGGTPVVTDSDALIFDTYFKVGRNIRYGQDIIGNPVAGLADKYSWFYALTGYAAHFDISNNVKFRQ